MRTFKSDLSQKEFPTSQKVLGSSLKESVLLLIRKDNPDFSEHNVLSISEVKSFNQKYIIEHLVMQTGEITAQEQVVLDSISSNTILADAIEDADLKELTQGQRLADKVASFGGSWVFIIFFVVFLLLWIIANAFILLSRSFDPYPFILLNLILSCLAALQAPVIMMSQNRQEEKDRERAKKDYMINLKAELEIKSLHEKIDRLIAIENKRAEQSNGNDSISY